MFLVTIGPFSAAFSAALAFFTTSAGRLDGPHRPIKETMLKSFRPTSAAVGTSGNAGTRLLLVTSKARSWPLDERRDHRRGVEHRVEPAAD